MKILLTAMISIFLFAGAAFADAPQEKLKQAVLSYKNANYHECQQRMQEIVSNDPGNMLAHYYLALTDVQLHNNNGASKEYNSVISLDPNSQLASYAKLGLSYLEIPKNTVDKPPVKTESQNIEAPKTVKAEIVKQTANSTPSQDEVAHALEVLSKSGMNQNMDPNMMQMNALMGGNGMMGYGMGNNNSMNMMPLMMMYQNSNNSNHPDPAAMQTILSNMMMNSMNSTNFNNNNNNNENY